MPVTNADLSVDSPNLLVGKPIDEPENEPREECGVFGVWAPGEDVAKLSYYGLYALQHRGQEAAGIAVSDGSQVLVFKDLGLVSQVFDEQTLGAMPGHVAIGHCRYSTSGSVNTSRCPEETHTWRGRITEESRPTTSGREVTIERHHCFLMFSFSSTPSGP